MPVGVATAERKPVPVTVTAVGNVQAYTTVSVKAQIAGQIMQVHFKEGNEVARGDLLFTIDQRPLQASVRQMEANVAKDRAQVRQMEASVAQKQAEVTQALANLERDLAQLDNARIQEERYRELNRRELIAREQYDQIRTNFSALQATVQADRAAVENAKASARAAEAMVENAQAGIAANEAMLDTARLQLAYTTIRAPMDGRTGNLLVQPGNVVKGNDDSPLVVIAQVRPIYVSFSVPEQHLNDIKRFLAQGKVPVEVTLDGGRRRAVGVLTFVNNTVDPTHRDHPAQGDVPQRRQRPVAGAVRRRRAHPHDGAGRGGPRPGGPGRTEGYVRLRGQTRSHRRIAPGHGGPSPGRRAGASAGPGGRRADRDRRAPPPDPGGEGRDQGAQDVVNTELFIRRPVLTTLLMAAIVIFGVMAYQKLPVNDLPNVDFPTIQVIANLPGASPETMASAVATPLERQFSTIAGIDSMTSTSALGVTNITIQFTLERNIDAAGQDVQAAIAKTAPLLPPSMPTPPIYQKVNPADQPVLYMALSSPTLPLYTVDEYAQTFLAQRISTISGVAQVTIFGSQKYAVRVQVDPRALAARGNRSRRGGGGHRPRERQQADRHALRAPPGGQRAGHRSAHGCRRLSAADCRLPQRLPRTAGGGRPGHRRRADRQGGRLVQR